MQGINPSNYERIAPFPEGSKPDEDFLVNLVVETPRGIRHKYAFDAGCGLFKLSSTIAEGLTWPYDYGFVPGTLGDDGDPLDVLFLCDEPTFTGCFVEARLAGIVRLEKNGTENDRLIATAKLVDGIAQSTDGYEKASDLPEPLVQSLCRFLVEYSESAGNKITFKGVDGRRKALAAIKCGIELFQKKQAGGKQK